MIIKNADNIAKRANSTLDEFVRAVKIDLFTGVIEDTRVDTGRMKGNWQTTVGSPATGTVSIRSESATVSDMERKSGGAGDTTYLTNNVPYVGVWEMRDGMVAKNIARIETNIRKRK
tara:strand:+ start:1401 stop:1751 length:351 start_codon:yes stop_codon:yes gene_type:complete